MLRCVVPRQNYKLFKETDLVTRELADPFGRNGSDAVWTVSEAIDAQFSLE